MIELDLTSPPANQRTSVKIFYATDAEHSLWRGARPAPAGGGLPPGGRARPTIHAQASSTGGEAASLSLVGRGDTWR